MQIEHWHGNKMIGIEGDKPSVGRCTLVYTLKLYMYTRTIIPSSARLGLLYILPCAGDGMHRLIGMIRTQHQAWNERMATRERQPLLAPPPPPPPHPLTSTSPPHPLTTTPHSEEDTGSFSSSRLQPESLSVYTLSSR